MDLIIGGTGTLGKALLKKLNPSDCIIFSRDELKQQQLKKVYPEATYILGDIRKKDDLLEVYRYHKVDTVYHFAAMKHVDLGECNVKLVADTNFQGVVNSYEAAMGHISNFIFTSTDKACMPINAYGMAKALAEKYLLHKQEEDKKVNIEIFRWGNILGSRGSVLSAFVNSIIKEKKIYLTSEKMTRFWLSIDEVVDFMLSEISSPKKTNGIKVPAGMKASPVLNIALCVHKILDEEGYDIDLSIQRMDIRPGEKFHEDMAQEFGVRKFSSDSGDEFTDKELTEKLRPLVKEILR